MNAFVTPSTIFRTATSTAAKVTSSKSRFTYTPRRSIRRVPASQLPTTATSSRTMPTANLESDVREELTDLYENTPCMPIMVRLGWHDAGTYNVKDGTGGANGSIRFKPERDHDANNGLFIAMNLLEPIKQKFPDISYADLYQLASVHAIEFARGPKIPFRLGRRDVTAEETTPDGRLPDANQRMGHLRDVFYRMGLNDKEITVLSGAHTLGSAHKDRSGFEGPWTKEPVVFDNSYFVEILKEDADPALLRLASDMALLDEPETRALCEKYAADQEAFFADYAEAHVKLSELGCFVAVA